MIEAHTATPESVDAALDRAFLIAFDNLDKKKKEAFKEYPLRKVAYYDLFVSQGLSVKEVASHFGVGEQAVRSALYRIGVSVGSRAESAQ